jgi:predicted NBD/HSP70 family sugar kinase
LKVVIGLLAPIKRATGRVMINNILPGWVDPAPAIELQGRIRHSAVVESDANLAALGERSTASEWASGI